MSKRSVVVVLGIVAAAFLVAGIVSYSRVLSAGEIQKIEAYEKTMDELFAAEARARGGQVAERSRRRPREDSASAWTLSLVCMACGAVSMAGAVLGWALLPRTTDGGG